MKEKLEQCRTRLNEEIKAAESGLEKLGHHVADATGSGLDELETRLNEALAKVDAKREHAVTAGHRIRQFLEETKDSTVAKFEDWKTDREIGKIEKHADKMEQQAVDALIVAAFAILEAEVAIVEALKARTVAIEVSG